MDTTKEEFQSVTSDLACVASVSSQGSSRKLGQEQKKNEGRGRGKKEPLARKPHDFEKLIRLIGVV